MPDYGEEELPFRHRIADPPARAGPATGGTRDDAQHRINT